MSALTIRFPVFDEANEIAYNFRELLAVLSD